MLFVVHYHQSLILNQYHAVRYLAAQYYHIDDIDLHFCYDNRLVRIGHTD